MSATRVFAAVLAALVVFGVLVLGYQRWDDQRRDERCSEQQFADAVNRDAGGLGLNVDDDCR